MEEAQRYVAGELLAGRSVNLNVYGYMRSGKSQVLAGIARFCGERKIAFDLYRLANVQERSRFQRLARQERARVLYDDATLLLLDDVDAAGLGGLPTAALPNAVFTSTAP